MPEKEQPQSQDPEIRPDLESGAVHPLTDKERLQRLTPPATLPEGEKTISLSELREQFADKLGRPSRWYLRDIKTIKRFWRRR